MAVHLYSTLCYRVAVRCVIRVAVHLYIRCVIRVVVHLYSIYTLCYKGGRTSSIYTLCYKGGRTSI